MNILNYLNVAIGFSLVMLLLSLVTSFLAQSFLTVFRRKAHGERHALRNILVDIGFDEKVAKELVIDLVFNVPPNLKRYIEDNKLPKVIGNFLVQMRFFFISPEQHISREEFVLLLLRKAARDGEDKKLSDKTTLANNLFFNTVDDVENALDKLEKAILNEETNNPTLTAQVWRSKAMSDTKEVSKLASKIFARYDEEMDRRAESFTFTGKFLGIIITLPILLVYWPVDSMDLFNRLNKDPVVTAKFADVAETNAPSFQKFIKCQESNKNNPDGKQICEQEEQAQKKIFDDIKKQSEFAGFFGEEVKKEIVCKIPILDIPITFFGDCKRAELTPGIFVTWILVSLGSAFWLALLNKIVGIRSEFSNKLGAQKDARENSTVLIVNKPV